MTEKENVMSSEEIQVAAFEIILNSGNARTTIHKAFAAMRKKEIEEAEKFLAEANEQIVLAHKSQTTLLKDYAAGKKIEMEIIMVHAQDHLMNTMTLLEVAEEMKFLHQQPL
ncbi:PTS cellobiose transporter subunit IIA [Vagococcus lutrae]|uniref:PTS cellobiose transporter subunit IIA n=1 Tax=Vagococcus lutrae TaxID=81947 RepID=UPI000F890963|nr:PTS cellobiose transporter subunit IIA [Vagococcus lutrae]MDY3705198.1 PTS cellobiose transporter subunit IIA [Vagococcus lutrae]RST92995.1 PTS cellobiose transporter subunit IIA [Vagococcus lutrae]